MLCSRLAHIGAAISVCSLPPCGGGLGRGVVVVSRAVSANNYPHPEQPGTWVTVLTGDMGNTFPVLFRSAVVADAVGLWATRLRCPQIHSGDVSACAGD